MSAPASSAFVDSEVKERSRGIIPYRIAQSAQAAPFVPEHHIQFLLIQHKHGLHWAFPKGHPEKNETPLENALREFEEETGISQKAIRVHVELSPDQDTFCERYMKPNRRGPPTPKISSYFIAEVPHDASQKVSVQESEVADYGWFELQGALDRITFDDGKNMLRLAFHQLTQLLQRERTSASSSHANL